MMVQLPCNNSICAEEIIIRSKIDYIKPPEGSNVAREIMNSFRSYPDRILLVDGLNDDGRTYTGKELWLQTAKIATGLLTSNIKLEIGEPTLMMCDHSIQEYLMFYGSLCAGAALMGTSPCAYDYVHKFCEPVKPRLIVTDKNQFEDAKRLRLDVPGMQTARIILIQEIDDHSHLEDGLDGVFSAQKLFDWPDMDENLIDRILNHDIDPKLHYSSLMMTSGSTGRSKVVPWTHEKQLNDIYSLFSASANVNSACGHEPLLPFNGNNLVLAGDLPLDQGSGIVAMFWCIKIGGKYVVIKPYDETRYWLDVERFRLTASIASSTFTYRLLRKLLDWLDNPPKEPIDISSMKLITCAGSKVNLESIMRRLRPIYNDLIVTQFYGATEIGFISMLSKEDSRQSIQSVGNLFPGVQAKVKHLETGATLGPDEEGEILVKSSTLFSQYLPHPEEKLEDLMANRFDDHGYYRTGDLVHYDLQERIYIHARLKDTLYLDKDWKTTPGEIEEIINKHSFVDSSVVIGVPDPEVDGCVLPKAFIKLKPLEEIRRQSATTSKDDDDHSTKIMQDLIDQLELKHYDQIKKNIFEYAARDVAEEKHLRGGIQFVDDYPRIGPFKKVDRRKLIQMA